MNFLSSEEHIKEWETAHPEFKNGSAITPEAGLKFITVIGKDRLDADYVTPLKELPAALKEMVESAGADAAFWGLA
jgi:hypothetical protein